MEGKIATETDTNEDSTHKKSNQAFVALWFNKKMIDPFYSALAEGIKRAGYTPYRVDEDPYVVKIDHAIIEKINESNFFVADLTNGKEGNRGNVYFEAGYAFGKEKNCIFTCRKGIELPFDIRQYSRIAWDYDNLNELVKEIEKKICEGPIGRGNVEYTPNTRTTFNISQPPQEEEEIEGAVSSVTTDKALGDNIVSVKDSKGKETLIRIILQ